MDSVTSSITTISFFLNFFFGVIHLRGLNIFGRTLKKKSSYG